ncbi:MAG: sigma-E factor negative regulatory protein [Gammaproteobacteria bacterium]
MSEQMKEQISMLMDGEMDGPGDQLISNLIQNKSLRDTWLRYHLISDVLKGQTPTCLDSRLVDRISARIADEPPILAPNAMRPRFFIKAAAGLAIAASVAAIAILGLQQNQTGQTATQWQQPLAQQSQALTAARQYTFPSRLASIKAPQMGPRNVRANLRMNSYLVNYNTYRTMHATMQGMIPYVRIVAYENDK